MTLAVALLCVIAMVLADLRWLRVAQREHYLIGSVWQFARRWWSTPWFNPVLLALALLNTVLAWFTPLAAVVVAVALAVGPIGLGIRGRTSKLAWTKRMKTLAAILGASQLAVIAFFVAVVDASPAFVTALVAIQAPLYVEMALWLARPIEERRASVFVERASKRLRSVAPTVVGITGSYGKTSTKNFLGHLLEGRRAAVLTPASFNNRAGLSRSINEHLTPGTEVFVAEMGTYGPGEIAELCRLCPPDISVFTAVGPVHLERFGSEENIVRAKSEIFETATVCVLGTDDPRLAAVADSLAEAGKTVWRCSVNDTSADVCLRRDGERVSLFVKGVEQPVAAVADVPLVNVACAVAVALQLDVPVEVIAERLATLQAPAHRQQLTVTTDGVTVIDDTYNANPAGVRRGLEVLTSSAGDQRRRIVVTPGMVELGERQAEENEAFAREAAMVATDVVIVGRTNRKALVRGAGSGTARVIEVDTLPQAVAWVRKHASSGDAVLYANDLPDHFA